MTLNFQQALDILTRRVNEDSAARRCPSIFLLYGIGGSGKSHLIRAAGATEIVLGSGLPKKIGIPVFTVLTSTQDPLSAEAELYEQLKQHCVCGSTIPFHLMHATLQDDGCTSFTYRIVTP